MQINIPGNSHNVVLGINKPANPIIKAAITILTTGFLGAFVSVNLNTKYTHGTIIKKQEMVVAVASPAMPKYGTKSQQSAAVAMDPHIRIYIGILGFPIPWTILVDMAKIE